MAPIDIIMQNQTVAKEIINTKKRSLRGSIFLFGFQIQRVTSQYIKKADIKKNKKYGAIVVKFIPPRSLPFCC
jgi:hypothetical protein